jgi:hypothetical protein
MRPWRLASAHAGAEQGDWMANLDASTSRPWWENRWLIAALIVASAVPLLYPPIPPLVDLFGHMGRYRVELDLSRSATLPL